MWIGKVLPRCHWMTQFLSSLLSNIKKRNALVALSFTSQWAFISILERGKGCESKNSFTRSIDNAGRNVNNELVWMLRKFCVLRIDLTFLVTYTELTVNWLATRMRLWQIKMAWRKNLCITIMYHYLVAKQICWRLIINVWLICRSYWQTWCVTYNQENLR